MSLRTKTRTIADALQEEFKPVMPRNAALRQHASVGQSSRTGNRQATKPRPLGGRVTGGAVAAE